MEVIVRGYEPRDAAGLADVFFRSVRQLALSEYTAAYIDLEPDGHINRLFCAPEAAGQGIASRPYDAMEAAPTTSNSAGSTTGLGGKVPAPLTATGRSGE